MTSKDFNLNTLNQKDIRSSSFNNQRNSHSRQENQINLNNIYSNIQLNGDTRNFNMSNKHQNVVSLPSELSQYAQNSERLRINIPVSPQNTEITDLKQS